MGKRRGFVGGVALAALLGITAAAIAHGRGDRPSVDQAAATTIVFSHAVIWGRTCEGKEGDYAEDRVLAQGTATGDPRLSGDVTLRVGYELVEVETGDGYQFAKLVIRDSETGEVKLRARAWGNGGIAEIWQGSLNGHAPGEGKFFASWRTTFHPNGAVTAQIGGEAADGRLPTVFAKGGCKGPFEKEVVELPPPEATAARSSSRAFGWTKG